MNVMENMGIYEHLSDLRKAILQYAIFTAIFFCICYANSDKILTFLIAPLTLFKQRLFFSGICDGFVIYMKISFYSSLILSIPFGIYKLLWFVKPALNKNEHKFFWRITIASFALFMFGLMTAYYLVIPLAWEFFISFESDTLKYLPNASDYISLFFCFVIAFGICFQIPVVLVVLSRLGLVTKQMLKNFRRYNVVLTFSISAILTPPDVTSQICLSVIILILYELTILFMKDKNA